MRSSCEGARAILAASGAAYRPRGSSSSSARSRPGSAAAAQCAAPSCCASSADVEARGRAVAWCTRRAADRGALRSFSLLDQIGQFEVLEEHVEELFLGQRELERVLALAVGAALAAAPPPPPVGSGISSPTLYSLLPGSTCSRCPELRLSESCGSRRLLEGLYLFGAFGIGDLARSQQSLLASPISPFARRRKR